MKRIEDLDYYELLNLKKNATQEEIEKGYLYGVASFHPDSLASYGLLTEEEKRKTLGRIEEAYQILSHPSKRKRHDLKLSETKESYQEKAHFRKTTSKLEIEDGEKTRKGIRGYLASLFKRKRKEEDKVNSRIHTSQQTSGSFNSFYSGDYLKKVRESQGVSLEEIARRSKLNISLLKALEEENYQALPSGVYTANLIKLYAHHLGLHPKELD